MKSSLWSLTELLGLVVRVLCSEVREKEEQQEQSRGCA